MGFGSVNKGVVIGGFSSVSAYMSSAGSGFSAGSGYSIGKLKQAAIIFFILALIKAPPPISPSF